MSLLTINHNISAMNTQRNLNATSFNLSKSLEKLSSGFRINTAADGPADLVISEGLRSQMGGIKAAIRNTQEASNLVSIAEGALNEVNSLLATLRALAVHAANKGVITQQQIDADQAELDNALETINRINAATRFAGQQVFKSGASAVHVFHIGEGGASADEVSLSIGTISAGSLSLNGLFAGSAVNLTSHANSAILLIDAAITQVATMRGGMGAFIKNTLQTNINSLAVSLENVTATESFIRDTNMAEETSNYTKNQILVQAGVSVLAQANVASQSVLQLLK